MVAGNAVALQRLGYHAHHQCCSLVRLPRRVAIAFHGSPAYGLLLALNGSASAVLLDAAGVAPKNEW